MEMLYVGTGCGVLGFILCIWHTTPTKKKKNGLPRRQTWECKECGSPCDNPIPRRCPTCQGMWEAQKEMERAI